MMFYLHTEFHEIQRSCDDKILGRTDGQTDGQTDGVTALLDLLSPSATQVKIKENNISTINRNGLFGSPRLLPPHGTRLGSTRLYKSFIDVVEWSVGKAGS